jgi:hypothetical protein
MSILTISPAQPTLSERLQLLLQRFFAGKRGAIRPNMNLADLSDDLLLDIGAEPRDVPNRTDEMRVVPYRSYGGLAAAAVLNSARS